MTKPLAAALPTPGTSSGSTPTLPSTRGSGGHALVMPAPQQDPLGIRMQEAVHKLEAMLQVRFTQREMNQAYAALDLKAVAAIGRGPYHPLRVVASADPRLEVKRQQQMTPDDVGLQVELWMAPLVADRVRDKVMALAEHMGKAARGQWVTYTASELAYVIRGEAAALGIEVMTAEQRQVAAERWAQRRWG